MKKFFIYSILFLLSIAMFAQEPSVKFYLDGTNPKSYNLEDIENIGVIKSQNYYNMTIFYQKTLTENFLTSKIESINFEKVNGKITNLIVKSTGSADKSFAIYDIDSITFTVLSKPVISGIDPPAAKIGDEIVINGSNFGALQESGLISFKGISSKNVKSWEDNKIALYVPVGAETGNISVTAGGIKSNEVYFQVIPNITGIDPKIIKIGDYVSVTGRGFGKSFDSVKVIFNNIESVAVIDLTDSTIMAEVPQKTTNGKMWVVVGSQKSNEVDYTLAPVPSITSINPTSFGIGEQVTINGTNFGAKQGTSVITFNTINAAKIKSWTNTKIECYVPANAKSGMLFITVNGDKSNEVSYKITSSIEMVLIPSGTFDMGNTGTYGGITYISEEPVHEVTISRDFYMSKYEIQQGLYTELMGTNLFEHKGVNFPADRISWYDAVAFCNALSERDGFTKCYTIKGTNVTCDWSANGYRLATEAEWEYACKAGTKSDFYSGKSESDLARVAWYSGNSGDTTHVPGQLEPNDFGLYDMLGNVIEWVWDWSGSYDSGSVTDPKGPGSGTVKILRGGSWHQGMANGTCRSSFRGWEDTPNSHSSTDGIRVVRVE